MVSNPIPATMILDMMTMEYPGHGWDLAVATGRLYPFDNSTVRAAHEAAARITAPEYRGDEKGQFRPVVPTPESATPLGTDLSPSWGVDPHWSQPVGS